MYIMSIELFTWFISGVIPGMQLRHIISFQKTLITFLGAIEMGSELKSSISVEIFSNILSTRLGFGYLH